MTGLTEADAIRRIGELDSLWFPAVMVWDPGTSASGNWEAMGDDGRVIEGKSPVAFCGELEKLDPGTAPAAGTVPGASAAGSEAGH